MTDTIDPQPSHSTPQAGTEPQSDSTEPAPAAPDDVAPLVAPLIVSIRAAVVAGASAEARAAGATACRSLLTVLEAKPGQPLGATPLPTASPASPIVAMLKQPGFLSQLAAMPREQLLDLLKQVTGAVPARPQTPSGGAPRFHLIQIPQVRRPDGT